MFWQIGRGRPHNEYATTPDGGLRVNGVTVTDERGWLEVVTPLSACARGAPPSIALRVRVVPDPTQAPLLVADEARIEGESYLTASSVRTTWIDHWLVSLANAVHTEIERRVAGTGVQPVVRTTK